VFRIEAQIIKIGLNEKAGNVFIFSVPSLQSYDFLNLFLTNIKIQRGNLIAVGNIGGLVPIQRVPRKYKQ
jgi:hypothetical protein